MSYNDIRKKVSSFIESFGLFSVLMIISSFASFSKTIVFSKFMEVDAFGEFSLILFLASPVGFIIGFSLEPGFLREGSICVGSQKLWKYRYLRDSCSSLALLTSIVSLITCLPALVFFRESSIKLFLFVLPLASVHLYFNLAATDFRIKGKNLTFVGMILAKNIFILAFGMLFLPLFGTISILFAELFIPFLITTFLMVKQNQRILWKIRFEAIRPLLKSGGPVSITYLIGTISSHSDKLILPIILTKHDYGLFSFGLIIFSVGVAVSNISTTILVPVLTKKFALNPDFKAIFRAYKLKTTPLSYIALISVLPVYFICSTGIQIFFVEYKETIKILPYILIGLFFYFLNLRECLFLVMNRSYFMLTNSLIVSIVSLASYSVGIALKMDLLQFSKVFLLVKATQYLLTEATLQSVCNGFKFKRIYKSASFFKKITLLK
jgi:O-antigen/teichoic acid export membrane protein